MHFVITQGTPNLFVLEYIKNTLGIGRVIKQGKRTFRFIIEQRSHLEFIILIFNGNMVLPSRIKRFQTFLDSYNNFFIKERIRPIFSKHSLLQPIPFIFNKVMPTLKDSWLSGFVDSEGCFSISITDSRVNIVFDISQKYESNLTILSHFILLFITGKIQNHSKEGNFSYRVDGLKNCEKIIDSNYFELFELKTTKKNSYRLWKELLYHIKNKDHLNKELRIELIKKSKLINPKFIE